MPVHGNNEPKRDKTTTDKGINNTLRNKQYFPLLLSFYSL